MFFLLKTIFMLIFSTVNYFCAFFVFINWLAAPIIDFEPLPSLIIIFIVLFRQMFFPGFVADMYARNKLLSDKNISEESANTISCLSYNIAPWLVVVMGFIVYLIFI